MTERLLGIDIGTTGVRAAVFDATGDLVADASAACAYDVPSPCFAEAHPEAWWRTTLNVLADLGSRVPLSDVAAVGIPGQAPTAVLVDAAGEPIRAAILWLDTRASQEASELGIHAYYLGPKLRWLARYDGDTLARARWILQSHAFIGQRLTGEVATDPSTAALCLPLFDLAQRRWIPSACASVGVRIEQLPPIGAARELLGRVSERAAEATRLRAGTPVMLGGGDFAAATLGAGVIEEGEACLMLGTAGNLLVPRKTPGTDPRLINAHHVGVDRWLSLGGTLSGGAQEWLRHALARGIGSEDTAIRGALPAFEVLDAEADRVAPGSDGLLFLPYLQGERTPIWDVDARGAYVGLGLHHGRGHLWRALLEGIALGFVDCQDALEDDGVRLRDVFAANGGGRSALFRQILCDALGVPLAYAPRAPGTVAGAALLAGLGARIVPSVVEARAWRGETVRHEPDPATTRRFRELLGVRRDAYRGLKDVFARLAPLRGNTVPNED
jgi:xylulokinase